MANFCEYVSDTFRSAWPQFESSLRKTRSQVSYMYYVNGICNYCKCDFLEITEKQARDYFSMLSHSEKKYSVKYLHSVLSGCRSIANYIAVHPDQYELSTYNSPFNSIILDGYSDIICERDIPTKHQIEKMLSMAKEEDPQIYLALALAFYCGLSLSEMLAIRRGNLIVDENEHVGLFLPSRPMKSQYVKIPAALASYMENYCQGIGDQSFLFANKFGRPMQRRTLQSNVSNFMESLGFSRKYTLQQLRNASVVYMMTGGVSSTDVADYIGVSNRWMYRYNGVVEALETAPCDYISIHA